MVKRTKAKLKKSNEVHKHHTYYSITNKGHYTLKSINEREYLKYLYIPCLEMLAFKKKHVNNEKLQKLINMGLLAKDGELKEMGKRVLDLAKRRHINLNNS